MREGGKGKKKVNARRDVSSVLSGVGESGRHGGFCKMRKGGGPR